MNSERYKNVIKLIVNQTNYTEEESKKKLKEWNNDYMKVIKEYLNPNFQNKKVEIKNESTNQKMMSEIRHFMDQASQTYINGKHGIETNAEKLQKQLMINAANQRYKNKKNEE
tara:strand:- start:42 stop:380 length:339 start_codon:yes stop_codon:yes gene_type:complete